MTGVFFSIKSVYYAVTCWTLFTPPPLSSLSFPFPSSHLTFESRQSFINTLETLILVTNYFETLLNCLNLITWISLPCGFKKYTEEKLVLMLQHRRFGRAEGLVKLCPWEQKPAVKTLSQSQK